MITCIDPIDQIIIGYSKHPSIPKTTEGIGHTTKFSFGRVTPPHIEKQISDLNPKKAVGYDSIPPKILKDSLNYLIHQSKKISFCLNFKYANVSPLFNKDDNTNKENCRLRSLPTISKIFERLMFQ